MLSFFPRGVLDEILNLIESVSERFPSYISTYVYPAAGHVITGNLRINSDSWIRSIIAKGPKYMFAVHIDFQKCREQIAVSLNGFCNRWCERQHVECDALKDWKLNIFKRQRQTYFLLFSKCKHVTT